MNKSVLLTCLMALLLCRISPISAQVAVSTDGNGPDNSAMLDVRSSSKGLLPPRIALISGNIAAPVTDPATGLLVFNTATAGTSPDNVSPGYYYWNGQRWLAVALPQGINPGDMLFWSGSGWSIVTAGLPGQFLQLSQTYVPTWVGNTFAFITTTDAASITETDAIVGGEITEDGGSAVTSRGICFSTSPMPDVADTAISCGSGTGSFSYSLTGLTGGTTYFVRAFAITSVGTAYGNEVTFTTMTPPPSCPGIPTVVYEGKTYHTVLIGGTCWIRENLNAGAMIDNMTEQTNNGILEKYCYNDLESNCDIYGGLYQWAEAVQYLNGATTMSSWNPIPTGRITGICPPGWSLPKLTDWSDLATFLGGDDVAGGKMKETGSSHWAAPNQGASDSSGFKGLPGGWRHMDGYFSELTQNGSFWTATEWSGTSGYLRYLRAGFTNLGVNDHYKKYGYSVRCFKDTCGSGMPVSVTITASSNPVSAGSQVTFTATAVNGGSAPLFQWVVNNIAAGTNSATYTITPSNNDQVKCVLTSNLACATGNPDTSNVISMVVNPFVNSCPGLPTVNYEGKTYNTVQIGSQCWFKENLDIGTRINGNLEQTDNGIPEKYCYNDLDANCTEYGGLYQWSEMMQYLTIPGGQGFCPSGWHIPTDAEWSSLAQFLGGESIAGGPMKEVGLTHWTTPNYLATNSSGFTGIPAGERTGNLSFTNLANYTTIWSSSLDASTWGLYRNLAYNTDHLYRYSAPKNYGFSVRCLKDTCSSYSAVSVSIIATANPVNSGTQVTFNATPVNGGQVPVYQWKINGINAGANSPAYTYEPVNNDIITCILSSNAGCVSGNPAVSNAITMIVSSVLPCPGIPTVVYGGKTYNTVQIGTQCWFKENLDIGSRINGEVQQSNNSVLEKYCYQDIDANCAVYGGMYQWNEMMQYNTLSNQGICPGGWHVPAWNEWNALSTFLGAGTGGGKMKEAGYVHWLAPNTGANNSSGFTALPAGLIYPSKFYDELTKDTYLWSSTDGGSSVQHITLRYTDENIQSYSNEKTFGFSVRCLKDTCTSYSAVSVSVSASANPVSAGTQVTFTAIAMNGGANPGYQWNVNGSSVASGSATYTYTPSNNDVIFCIVTSQLTCTSGNPATSNSITMQVAAIGAPCPGVAQISYGGQTYNTVQIGVQCWLRENLNIGLKINGLLQQSDNAFIEKYCYNDLESNCDIYGGFYQWAEMVQYLNGATNYTSWNPAPAGNIQGICPSGWHIPSDDEWTQIANTLGGESVAGGAMKETGFLHWLSPNADATNSSGFTAFGNGHREPDGGFYNQLEYSNYWAATQFSDTDAWSRALGSIAGALWRDSNYGKTKGFSVRCVKNNP